MPNIKKIFKKETNPDIPSLPSSIGLSKLFHRHDSKRDLPMSSTTSPAPIPVAAAPPHTSSAATATTATTGGQSHIPPSSTSPITPPQSSMRRAASVTSLKRRNTNPIQSSTSTNTNNHHTNINTNTNSNTTTTSPTNANAHANVGAGTTTTTTNLHHLPPIINRHRSNSERVPVHPGRKALTKADTFAHLNQLDTRNAQKNLLKSSRVSSAHNSPATPGGHGDKIVYNPYGLNKNSTQERPKNTSFYMSGANDGERVLSNPVASPNDFLPDNLKQKHVNLLEDFEIDAGTRKLGDGGSSDVRIINSCFNKKHLFALKRFTLLSKESDQEFYHRVLKEYILHKEVAKCRHVVDVIAILRIQSQSNLTRGWGMVMEFCGGGDLFSLIVKPGWKQTPLVEKYCLFKQISYGVKFLHDHDIVHRDLKPENVLLDANGLAKLCDFGVSEHGHEITGDFTSPVKLSTAYVGSPPYAPPEVMILKEKSSSEVKAFAYDPFKMDCWGLGMLLFCLVYGGVPFQQSSPNDHAFRDYKFSHKRFCTDHHNFKDNVDYPKGPGSEFKLAAKFENLGASRVAWKLCDPSPNTRYTTDMLFEDPWFKGLEMCIYEHPDQEVNPFVLPGTGGNINTHPGSGSGYSSAANSQAPSRRGTFSSRPVGSSGYDSHDESLHTPIKSMLDLTEVSDSIKKSTMNQNSTFLNNNTNGNTHNGHNGQTTHSHSHSQSQSQSHNHSHSHSATNIGEISSSNNSLHSSDSISSKIKSRLDPGSTTSNNVNNPNPNANANANPNTNTNTNVNGSMIIDGHSSSSSTASSPMNSAPPSIDKINQAISPVNGNLPAVEESDIEHEQCDPVLEIDFKHHNPIIPKEEFPTIPVSKNNNNNNNDDVVVENIPIPKEELEVEKDPKIKCEPLTEIIDEHEDEHEQETENGNGNDTSDDNEKLPFPTTSSRIQSNEAINPSDGSIRSQQQQQQQRIINNNASNFNKESSPSSFTHDHDTASFSANESIISVDRSHKPNHEGQADDHGDGNGNEETNCVDILLEGFCTLADLEVPVFKEATDLQLNKDGTCELGYKIKKHHHTEVSNVSNTGTRR